MISFVLFCLVLAGKNIATRRTTMKFSGPAATPASLPPPTSMLDAKQFGAVGNGVADDAPALQRALDASQQQHRALFIPAGTYLINATLTVRNNKEAQYSTWGSVRLLGEGNLGEQSLITPGRMLTALLAFSGKGPQGAVWEWDNCPPMGNTSNGQ